MPPPHETQAASDLLGWLLGQSAALVVSLLIGGLWVRSLRRDLLAARRDLSSYRQRNEVLSNALLRHIESASLERTRQSDQRVWLLDSTMRSFVDSLRQVLANALTFSESSGEPSERETE